MSYDELRIPSKWCYAFKSGLFSIESHGDVRGSDEPIVRFSFARLRTTPTALSWGTSARKSSSVMGSGDGKVRYYIFPLVNIQKNYGTSPFFHGKTHYFYGYVQWLC